MEEKENLKSNIKAIVAAIVVAAVLIGAFILIRVLTHPREYSKIIVSNFVAYDLVRSVVGNEKGITMLVEPGKNFHDYKPTNDDLEAIKSADLFVYFGGKSESWVNEVITEENSMDEKYLRLDNYLALRLEPKPTTGRVVNDYSYNSNYYQYGSEEDFDEHVWTSLTNVITMSHIVTDRLVSLYPEESEKYYKKSQDYTMRLNDIDQQFRRLLMTSIDRKTFVFAGYFPFQYMFEDYNINYFAKDYCGKEQTGSEDEIAADYIAAAKNLGNNIVFKAEYSNDGVINKIKSDPEIKVIELNAVHSISSQDFNAGVTFADIMDRNYRIVEEVFSDNQDNR